MNTNQQKSLIAAFLVLATVIFLLYAAFSSQLLLGIYFLIYPLMFIIFFVVLYYVVKKAVKDGMAESK
ncbi:hypothetical protein MsAg5_12850 [Methanosarcinaceae archaeon Ag5]|uniref:Uncharacterized protein n=1 Tax=Methanolapillus africanus TaxID=3028297 RepID=A0AAE4SDH9_9EURY|nr:hypothetical protein [Methanosarcinaceae archaeon Ag5]